MLPSNQDLVHALPSNQDYSVILLELLFVSIYQYHSFYLLFFNPSTGKCRRIYYKVTTQSFSTIGPCPVPDMLIQGTCVMLL